MPPLVFLQTRKLTRVMIAISPRVPDSILFWLKECAKSFSGSGFARDRTGAGGAHSAVPDTVADKGGRRGRGEEGREERNEGEGGERKGKEGRLPPLEFRSAYALAHNTAYSALFWAQQQPQSAANEWNIFVENV